MMDPGGDWELQKENIQPLTSGRNISILKHSLETSKNMANYEADMDQQLITFEDKLTTYVGEDQLEPWISLIHFLENSCLLAARLKVKLHSVLMRCVKKFNEDPKYRNDKRFIDIFLKCMSELDPGQRVKVIQNSLFKGTGKTVSQMYIAIAELQESIGKPAEAVQTLRLGIRNEAQPIEKLKDSLSQLEYRVAKSIALQTVNSRDTETGDRRHFGSSVPVYGEKNDASVFRSDLQPAIPVASTKPDVKRPGTKHVPLYDEKMLASVQPTVAVGTENPTKLHNENADVENKLRPSKWNKPDAVLTEEPIRFVESIRPRLQLYTDSSEARTVRVPAVQTGVLQVRKEDSPSNLPTEILELKSIQKTNKPPSITATVQNYKPPSQQQTESSVIKSLNAIRMDGKEVTFEHRQRIAWLKKQDIVEALKLKVREVETALWKKDKECIELMAQKQKLSSLYTDMEYKLKQTGAKLKVLTEQLETQRIQSSKNESRTAIAELKSNRLSEQLEREIKEKSELIREWTQKEQNYLEKIELLTSLMSQPKVSISSSSTSVSTSGPSSDESTVIPTTTTTTTTTDSNEQNRDVSPDEPELSFRPDFFNRTEKEAFNASVRMCESSIFEKMASPAFNFNESAIQRLGLSAAEVSDFLPPPRNIPRRLPFTLYESHMESPSSSSKVDNNPNSNQQQTENRFQFPREKAQPDFKTLSENLPPLPLTTPLKNEQFDFENQNEGKGILIKQKSTAREEIRGGAGIVGQTFIRPSHSRGVIFGATTNSPDLNENEEIVNPHRYRKDLDFNLSNLTRALAFHPEPLLNSTPERKMTRRESEYQNLNVGNYIHTQRLPIYQSSYVLPSSSGDNDDVREFATEQRTVGGGEFKNLSPIQETSKENRSSASSGCTTGSSSGNMTSNRGGITTSGNSLYNITRSVSGGPPRSVSRYQYQQQ